jgi:Peptidase propeptide and YPEB domain
MLHRWMAITAVLALAAASASMARADDDDDRRMRSGDLSQLESVLRDAGYTSWEEIEHEDGGFEVDDARGPDGRERDLGVDGRTFKIRDDD